MTTGTAADVRAAMLAAAERQLAASADHDIATRAVCEAVGVTQPVLYRLFGDKRGLLDALADDGFERYLAEKAAQAKTDDPVADLRTGWDRHMDFARRNQALYQLMFSPRPRSGATARQRVYDLLEEALTRCAAVGALRIEPRLAAQLILPANIGVALSLIAEPGIFDDPGLSHRMREAVFGAILVEPAAGVPADPLRAAALSLHSQLALDRTDVLEPAEAALLARWLERLTQAGPHREARTLPS